MPAVAPPDPTDAATADAASPSDEIRVGISACILGQEVRYNGGHKLDRFIRDTLGAFVSFVPVCPEFELGLGVPRETLRLEQPGGAETLRLVAPRSGSDHTAAMVAFARAKARDLGAAELCGYILQKGSPSCGMERVRVYGASGMAQRNGRGLFAQVLMEALPDLPVEEDGRLNDPRLRENFIERLFAYRRLRRLFRARWTRGELVAFHSREKLLLLAHDRPSYEALGRLVAAAKQTERSVLVEQYRRLFLGGLARIATARKQTNVLQHIAGHLRERLDQAERGELHELIESYHRQWVPLVVPLTLIRHHVRRHGLSYLAQQSYLDPHPQELMLRNHV